jgi:hypothetical protein
MARMLGVLSSPRANEDRPGKNEKLNSKQDEHAQIALVDGSV